MHRKGIGTHNQQALTSRVAFIFDMDGVIVDSNPFHKIALKQFCKKYGKDLSEDELREKIYGRRNQDWLANIFGHLDDKTMKRYADEKEKLFRDLYADDIQPLGGLEEFLKGMSALNIPAAIATSAPRSNVDFTLEKTGLAPYFKAILDDSFVKQGKPHPDIYLKAAGALNFNPEDCVVFEDSLAGVQSGLRAGCKVVGLSTTHSAEELSDAAVVVPDFNGLKPKDLIARLFEP